MKKLTITASPHVFSPMDTRYLMKGVMKALVPAVVASLYFFRWRALLVMLTAVLGCIVTEYVLQRARGRKIAINDFSGVVTGILLALVLPPSIPLWMVFIGAVVAIGLGKETFGGLGHNIFNPVLLA
ncbi:MAG: RnfABCDGE type electron transport complex subunit D, partial [Candidatus Omnitrophota bacterium]